MSRTNEPGQKLMRAEAETLHEGFIIHRGYLQVKSGVAYNHRLLYQLSQEESTLWQHGGPAALAFQHQLAELHRQDSLSLAPIMDVFHPDGILSAQHIAPVPIQEHAVPQGVQVSSSSQSQEPTLARESITAPERNLGRAEGTVIETSTVTAYQMSARESAAWSRGDHEARMVEANIGDALKDVGTSQPVAVLLDDGRAMYTYGSTMFQDMAAALGLMRDRLSALASGVQVHMDVSVQLGAPQNTLQASLETLQHRADALTQPTPQRAQSQGISY